MNGYRVLYYVQPRSRRVPVKEYIEALETKAAAKVFKYIEFLREREGYLDEPYSKHITGSIRELRVDFGRQRHRVFYFTFVGKTIILLHAFTKKTPKTPPREIEIAVKHFYDVFTHHHLYE